MTPDPVDRHTGTPAPDAPDATEATAAPDEAANAASPFAGRPGTVVAGFVDLQLNGGWGHDFTLDPASIWEVGARLPAHGVTAFLPTVITAAPIAAIRALETLAAGPPPGWQGARPLGIHLEGPMIAADRRGTHPVDALVAVSPDLVAQWLEVGPPTMVTLAPELPGALDAIEALAAAGVVVAIGHSDADLATAQAAFAAGATHVTHLFNAMSGLHHRTPGVAAAALLDDHVTMGLVADGIHVHPRHAAPGHPHGRAWTGSRWSPTRWPPWPWPMARTPSATSRSAWTA